MYDDILRGIAVAFQNRNKKVVGNSKAPKTPKNEKLQNETPEDLSLFSNKANGECQRKKKG
jgi:hypothetical protein